MLPRSMDLGLIVRLKDGQEIRAPDWDEPENEWVAPADGSARQPPERLAAWHRMGVACVGIGILHPDPSEVSRRLSKLFVNPSWRGSLNLPQEIQAAASKAFSQGAEFVSGLVSDGRAGACGLSARVSLCFSDAKPLPDDWPTAIIAALRGAGEELLSSADALPVAVFADWSIRTATPERPLRGPESDVGLIGAARDVGRCFSSDENSPPSCEPWLARLEAAGLGLALGPGAPRGSRLRV